MATDESRWTRLVDLSKEFDVPLMLVSHLSDLYDNEHDDDKMFAGVIEHMAVVKRHFDKQKTKKRKK